MLRKAWGVLFFAVLTVATGLAQQQGGYLDVYIAKVKPEKEAEFDAVNKKIADANRRHDGDIWLALETTYGEQNTVSFSSPRQSYAEVEKSFDVFMGALVKAYGQAGATALMHELDSTLVSSRTEIRQRRWDLSYNPPADSAAYMQTIAKTRWIRSAIVHVRPGHQSEFEAELKEITAASQKSNQPGMRWVSQVSGGGSPGTYYVSRLMTSLSELDQTPTMQELLGEEGYQKFQRLNVEAVENVEYVIFRVLPEISSPPPEVAAAVPDFWSPKPKAAVTAKPSTAEPAKSAPKSNP
jgi:quinol monooxygenase YgiN